MIKIKVMFFVEYFACVLIWMVTLVGIIKNWWCLKVIQFVWIFIGWVRLGEFIGSVFGEIF